MAGFGFEPPQGDPGALQAASGSWRNLGLAFLNQGEAVTSAARTVLGVGGWQGTASEAFVADAERLIKQFTTDSEACGRAATAIADLGHALERAQQATRQALADCGRAQSEASAQQTAADQAGQAASAAQQAAAQAVHPATAAALNHEANQALDRQGAAQSAAGRAQGDLSAAQARGQQALSAYEHEAQSVIARLNAAAAELNGAQETESNWADALLGWLGHANDFGGAGATALVKQYEAQLAVAGRRLVTETEEVLGDPQAVSSILAGRPLPLLDSVASDPVWDTTATAASRAYNPLTRLLTASPSEDAVGVLGKVPYLGYGLTAADMIMNRNEGIGKSVVEPLGNLAVGTALTEGTSSAIVAIAGGDGALAAMAGAVAVPGVGEVVIVGAVVVVGTYAIDKGAEWAWEHRAEIGHALSSAGTATLHGLETAGSATLHGLETAGSATVHGLATAGSATVHGLEDAGSSVAHTASHLAHDAEPWNW